MPPRQSTASKKFEKALQQAAKAFNIDTSQIQIPLESKLDVLREAASVIAYFDHKEEFKEETCRNCNRKFVYAFYTTAVKCCSIACMAAHLASLGLKWDPEAPVERRWGPRGVPAIVPAEVYAIIQEQAPPISEVPAPVIRKISSEAEDLIATLSLLAE
jgi:hypothetical protein